MNKYKTMVAISLAAIVFFCLSTYDKKVLLACCLEEIRTSIILVLWSRRGMKR